VSTIINIVTVLILVVFAKLGLVGLFWSFILGQLSCFLFLELNLRMIKNLSFNKFNLNILKKMLKFSSPLILNLISNWLIFSFGRILLLQYFGENINGLYSFANRLTVVITLLGSVVTMSLIEESIMMAKEHSISKESSYIINVLIVAFLTFSIMFIPASKLFFLVVRNTEYYVAHKYMPLLILFSLLSVISTIIGSIFQAISKTQVQFFSTLIGALFSVAFSFLLLNWLDEYGIIWGQIIGSGVMIVIRYIMAYKYIKIKLNFYVYVLLIALFSATSFIAIKYNFIENIILLVCATIVFFILNRKIIIDLFGMLKKLIKKPQTDPK
jgi:O-antigen/teichoic acid export membrane protein